MTEPKTPESTLQAAGTDLNNPMVASNGTLDGQQQNASTGQTNGTDDQTPAGIDGSTT